MNHKGTASRDQASIDYGVGAEEHERESKEEEYTVNFCCNIQGK